MNYCSISNFGSNMKSSLDNPLTYCMARGMDQRFNHGSHSDTLGKDSRACQLFMSQYCADNWDGFCEVASMDPHHSYPNNAQHCGTRSDIACKDLTAGESLIHSAAQRKYLVKMHHAEKKYEPFDPIVPNSPMISYWVSNDCSYSNPGIPEYAVDPKTIDKDIIMNKILNKLDIAPDVLVNIYNTMKRQGTLAQLKGTRLGNLYTQHPYFKHKGGLGNSTKS